MLQFSGQLTTPDRFSYHTDAPYHVGVVLFSVQTHPWLEDPISLLAVVIAYVHRFQDVGLCVGLPVRGDSFTGGGGTCSLFLQYFRR